MSGPRRSPPRSGLDRHAHAGERPVLRPAAGPRDRITLSTEPELILLDEPTAGMTREETAQAIRMIDRVTAGRTLVIIEHDMEVVFSLADTISVLHYGKILVSDTPERDPHRPAGQRRLPGGRIAMLAVKDIHSYYGMSHILHGVSLELREGSWSACSDATGWASRPP